MIISTVQSDTMLKKALGKNKTSIISPEKMFDQFSIDPTLTTPVRDAYIVTDADIRAMKIKQKFEQCLATKHPNTKVIFIVKGKNNPYPEGMPGIDVILKSPRPNEIVDAISAVMESGQIQEAIENGVSKEVNVPNFNPVQAQQQYTYENSPEFVQQQMEEEEERRRLEAEAEAARAAMAAQQAPEEIPLPPADEEPVQKEPEPRFNSSQLAEDIKQTNRMADINILTREISSAKLIKDLIDSNSTYAAVEEKVKAIQDAIFLIMNDKNIRTLDEKLSKVRGLVHDKDAFAAKGDTLVEQRLEEIVDTICSQTQTLLESRLNEINTAIRNADTQREMGVDNARLAGLNEESANMLIELHTLEKDLLDIFKSTNTLIMDTAVGISENSANLTGNDMLNARLRASGGVLVSDETLTAIRASMELSTETVNAEFKEMRLKVISMISLLNKMFELDREQIAAYQATVNFMKANNIEDTIVAESLLKKSLRVFIGAEKSGRTIIPYLLSKYKSNQNANVLLIDITGTGKYHEYGIQVNSIENYLVEMNQAPFFVAAGEVENTIATAQRIVNALIKSADYYRVINVVMRPDQRELFETIAQDVLCVNYLVDSNPSNIEDMRKIMDSTRVRNVGRRVIINKCDVAIRPIISKLGLDEELDFQACVIPTIPSIVDANLNHYNPYGISSVTLSMEETLKHA